MYRSLLPVDEILESITDAFYAVDKDWRVTYLNHRTEQWWRRRREDLLGKVLWDEFPDQAGTMGWRKLHEAMHTRRQVHWEAHSRYLNRWVGVSVYPISSGGITVYFRDISERKLADEALRQSEARYRELFNAIEEGFCIIEVCFDGDNRPCDFRFLETNRAFERHTGLTDVTGMCIQSLAPDNAQYWVEKFGAVALAGGSTHFQDSLGDRGRFFETYAYRVGPPEQRRVAVLFDDITGQRRLEQHQAFLSDISRELVQFSTVEDTTGRLSKRIGRYFGAVASVYAELLDTPDSAPSAGDGEASTPLQGICWLRDYLTETQLGRNDAGIPTVVCDTQADPRVRSEIYPELGVRSFLLVPISRGGHWRLQLSIIDPQPRLWRDDEVSLLMEIAERIWIYLERARAEETLRESRLRLEEELSGAQLLHHISTELLFEDDTGASYEKILDAAMQIMRSDCASLQLLHHGPQGDLLKLLASRGLDTQAQDHWREVSTSSGTVCAQALRMGRRTIVRDTQDCPFIQAETDRALFRQNNIQACQTTPLFSRRGELVGMLSTHWQRSYEPSESQLRLLDVLARQTADLIEYKQAETALRASEAQGHYLAKALEKKNQLVTDFFINISHEFKTPLTILMLGLELLETKAAQMKDEGKGIERNLVAMKQNTYRLSRLVGNLLDITKLDAGFMQPKWEAVDIAALLRGLTQSVEPYARQRQLALEYHCQSDELSFTTDSFMLERIVLNLLSNAIKHTPAGGSIRMDCHTEATGLCITVQDTGEGIPADKLASIFDRFSQVDTRMTRTSEGSGIGLALTKSFVELLDGQISVQSTPRVGSTFAVRLPAVQPKTTGTAAEQIGLRIDKRVQLELSDLC